MSHWKKIIALLAVVAPLGVFASACAMDATAPEEPQDVAVAAVEANPNEGAMACYHYYGDSYSNSDCHSFWFNSDFNFLVKHCEPGPCSPFPRDWADKSWGSWGPQGDRVTCRGTWWPSEQQKERLRAAFDAAPNC